MKYFQGKNRAVGISISGATKRFLSCKRVAQSIAAGVLFGLVLSGTGCVRPPVQPFPTKDQLSHVDHTVKASGETLFAIAAWYTGQGLNWKQIVEANPGLNPNRIKIGEVIHIPRKLVVRTETMGSVSGGNSAAANSGSSAAKRNARPKGEAKTEPKVAVVPEAEVTAYGEAGKNGSGIKAAPKNDDSDFADIPSEADKGILPQVATPKAMPEHNPIDPNSAASLPAASVDPVGGDVGQAATSPRVAASPTAEQRTKSRDELLQELLKDY